MLIFKLTQIFLVYSVKKVYWVDKALKSVIITKLSTRREPLALKFKKKDNWVLYTLITEIVKSLLEL